MEHFSMSTSRVTIGLDLGDKYSFCHAVGSDGNTLHQGRLRTTPEALRKHFGELEAARVAIEVGTHSPWVSRLLKQCGHEVVVANPRQLRVIYTNKKKSDKVDAECLARVGRLDPKLLAPIQHRGIDAQVDLTLLHARDALVRSRTLLVNQVRSTVKSLGTRLPRCAAQSFHRKALEHIPDKLRSALIPLVETIGELTARIHRYDREIEALSNSKYPETKVLAQPKGVGPVTALAFVLILEDPHRFEKSRKVGAYLGLVPRHDDSGQQTPQLRITKAGDPFLRRLLVTSAHYILGPLGPDTDLRRFGDAIARRGGKNAKKRAVVAVARKLAVLLHCLWRTGQDYDPLRNRVRKENKRIAATIGT